MLHFSIFYSVCVQYSEGSHFRLIIGRFEPWHGTLHTVEQGISCITVWVRISESFANDSVCSSEEVGYYNIHLENENESSEHAQTENSKGNGYTFRWGNSDNTISLSF